MEAVSEPDPKFQQLLNKRRWVLWLFNFPILIHSRLRQLIERSSRQDLARQNRNPKIHAKPQRKDWPRQSSKKRTILKDGTAKRKQNSRKTWSCHRLAEGGSA